MMVIKEVGGETRDAFSTQRQEKQRVRLPGSRNMYI